MGRGRGASARGRVSENARMTDACTTSAAPGSNPHASCRCVSGMGSPSTTTVMWGGVCHTIAVADARILVRSGMATPSRQYLGSYSGLVYASSEYRTPEEALAVLARQPSASGLARAASQRGRAGGKPVAARPSSGRFSARR